MITRTKDDLKKKIEQQKRYIEEGKKYGWFSAKTLKTSTELLKELEDDLKRWEEKNND